MINHNYTVIFVPYMDYQIHNPLLAQHMINHDLGKLNNRKLFGSGWKLYQIDYPHFVVDSYNTVIYDSTHVDPSLK